MDLVLRAGGSVDVRYLKIDYHDIPALKRTFGGLKSFLDNLHFRNVKNQQIGKLAGPAL